MEKRHRCKLCFRNFANGRALGGHMRSHMMKFYDEAAANNRRPEKNHLWPPQMNSFSSTSVSQTSFPSSSSSSSSSSEEEEIKEIDKPIAADHDFYAGGFFPVRKRSKPGKGEGEAGDEDENEKQSSLSSISDTTPEENVARCLIMLSRDTWTRADLEFHDSDGEGARNKNWGNSGVGKGIKGKVRGGKYRCEECGKVFKSYQALGGHRASHKKVRVEHPRPESNSGSCPKVEKLHECPFCRRIFPSGQALGGHKRSHFVGQVGANSGNVNSSSPEKQIVNSAVLDIDLNMPAPVEDDEGSQVAVSVVSAINHFCQT
ncbi:zinc finger family protein [Striga asiatica]|uniref:Zinc finger family protein n=1 Tax=Striga asiatica TaxID=4170 RepID=A0A5A7QHN5_STRAF|nr:zinc finger family protein [Striga asiatica]